MLRLQVLTPMHSRTLLVHTYVVRGHLYVVSVAALHLMPFVRYTYHTVSRSYLSTYVYTPHRLDYIKPLSILPM